MVLNVSNVNVLQTQWQQIYLYYLNLTWERKKESCLLLKEHEEEHKEEFKSQRNEKKNWDI